MMKRAFGHFWITASAARIKRSIPLTGRKFATITTTGESAGMPNCNRKSSLPRTLTNWSRLMPLWITSTWLSEIPSVATAQRRVLWELATNNDTQRLSKLRNRSSKKLCQYPWLRRVEIIALIPERRAAITPTLLPSTKWVWTISICSRFKNPTNLRIFT